MKPTKIFATLLFLAAGSLSALDGKWMPQQVLEIDPEWLAEQGLLLGPDALWDAERGTGLLTAAVRIGGCSGGFVSSTGLIVTNHHCLFSLLQEHSTPERDLITNGFLARSPEEELPGGALRVNIPRRFTDVTTAVLAAVPARAGDRERSKAIASKRRALVQACEKKPDTKCRVAVFDDGVHYVLIETMELRDIRLVYAPPRGVGEFGGEIDNWSWPRHTGDFAVARAWADPAGRPASHSAENVPYTPEFFFPIAQDGIGLGDFVMVLGYPGITYRSLVAEEMGERKERFFMRREDLFGEWSRILEETTAEDPEGSLAVAANLKSILNRHKNAIGQIEALERGRIIEKQAAADDAVAAWARDRREHAAALTAREELRKVLAERERTWERDFLLSLIPLGVESIPGGIPPLPKGLYYGATLAHLAREGQKRVENRAPDFAPEDVPRIRERMLREERNFHEPADREIFSALVRRALALGEEERIAAVDRFFGGLGPEEISERIDSMYARTRLLDASEREVMLGENPKQLASREDPLLQFAIAWSENVAAMRERQKEWDGRIERHRPVWRRAVTAHAGQPIAPDANSTLRVSFAHVQGYEPRDGVYYLPFTTLSGAIAKHTGEPPFNLPSEVIAAAAEPAGRWADADMGDIPVNFLADGDTSGGSSGSPVVNGRGELVGANFDRVWENVANDFGFNPAVARNISVDIRYLLWTLEHVENATELLDELGISSVPGSRFSVLSSR
jgi:hypothetical protein